MEAAGNFILTDEKSTVKNQGETKVTLDENYLTLTVDFGEPLMFSYSDMINIQDQDYKIEIEFTSKEKITLTHMGYQYEDFLFQLFKLRNQQLLKYLLMQESLLQDGFEAQYASTSPNQPTQNGKCEIRLYETALLVLPQKNQPLRLPYCYISQIAKGDYKLTITDENQQKIELTQLGGNFDPMAKGLSDAYNKMITRSQETIKELIPEVDPLVIRKIASQMKDGRAAKRKDIQTLSSIIWPRLTNKIKEANLKSEYDFLNSLSMQDQECVGIKRGLMGDLTGSYIWMLFPLSDPSSGKLSNTVAMEAFNFQNSQQEDQLPSDQEPEIEETTQNLHTNATGATYFFKIMQQNQFANTSENEHESGLADFIASINRAMIDINFRREPIYLSDEQLQSTKYTQYRFAIQNIPSLKLLRSLFIGRAIHSSLEQWKANVSSLLTFNNRSLQ